VGACEIALQARITGPVGSSISDSSRFKRRILMMSSFGSPARGCRDFQGSEKSRIRVLCGPRIRSVALSATTTFVIYSCTRSWRKTGPLLVTPDAPPPGQITSPPETRPRGRPSQFVQNCSCFVGFRGRYFFPSRIQGCWCLRAKSSLRYLRLGDLVGEYSALPDSWCEREHDLVRLRRPSGRTSPERNDKFHRRVIVVPIKTR